MSNVRLPMAVCAAVADILEGSHATLDALFKAAGVPGDPPDLAHHSKWKTWLFQAGNDPEVDSLAVLGNLIEEFMDLPPDPGRETFGDVLHHNRDPLTEYQSRRQRLVTVLEEHRFRYFRGGRVLPSGDAPVAPIRAPDGKTPGPRKPSTVNELLEVVIRGLPRAIHPLEHRRRDALSLSFDSEYDIQDLLHALLRPWISDIRPEEFTPSYAGSSTRMDFLLPAYKIVIETKRIRDKGHARRVGNELIVDIEHYRRHPDCETLWCVVYDSRNLMQNPTGLATDLEGARTSSDGSVEVRVFVLAG